MSTASIFTVVHWLANASVPHKATPLQMNPTACSYPFLIPPGKNQTYEDFLKEYYDLQQKGKKFIEDNCITAVITGILNKANSDMIKKSIESMVAMGELFCNYQVLFYMNDQGNDWDILYRALCAPYSKVLCIHHNTSQDPVEPELANPIAQHVWMVRNYICD